MINLAATYFSQGRYDDVLSLESEAVETMRDCPGFEILHFLKRENNLASTYRELGRYDEAREILLRLKIRYEEEKLVGHADFLTCTTNLAAVSRLENKLEEAKKVEEHIEKTRTRLFGAEHPDTLTSKLYLALITAKMGLSEDLKGHSALFKEAMQMKEEVRKTKEKFLRKDHPDTLKSLRDPA